MTLHDAILKVLREWGSPMAISEIASLLNKTKWYQKQDGSNIEPGQIRLRVKNYPSLFVREGNFIRPVGSKSQIISTPRSNTIPRSQVSDEAYVLDICDSVLGFKSLRQYKFEFLRGDSNKQGRRAYLPVDAYYPDLNLVIEYMERQHFEPVNHFDKPDRLTISGISRGEQRKKYDQRRRETLPQHGIQVISIAYDELSHTNRKKLKRDIGVDKEVIIKKLTKYLC